jgi:hypothetical protein
MKAPLTRIRVICTNKDHCQQTCPAPSACPLTCALSRRFQEAGAAEKGVVVEEVVVAVVVAATARARRLAAGLTAPPLDQSYQH